MKNILRIDASARQNGSLSRMLSDVFLEQWKQLNSSYRIMNRDVGSNPPPSIHESWIAAAFTPEESRNVDQRKSLQLSDRLIEELAWADIILMATPLYNYGMPSSLKAWLDHIVRIDQTFTFDLARGDRPLKPILGGKQLVLLTSTGEFGFGKGGINEGMDHLTPHIRSVAKYMGVEKIHQAGIEYQEFKDERHEASKKKAIADTKAIAFRLQAETGQAAA